MWDEWGCGEEDYGLRGGCGSLVVGLWKIKSGYGVWDRYRTAVFDEKGARKMGWASMKVHRHLDRWASITITWHRH